MKLLRKNAWMFFVALAYVFTSCSSSRHSDGFYYRSVSSAPDISSGNEKLPANKIQEVGQAQNSTGNVALKETENINLMIGKISGKMPPDVADKLQKISEEFKKVSHIQEEEGTPLTNRELLRKATNNLVKAGTINQLSDRDMKKLDRVARKMDNKMQKEGKDIDVKNNTNLELFFLIMGVAGLVLGILGVWIGWLLFVVFGGLYLYYKLVK